VQLSKHYAESESVGEELYQRVKRV